MRRLFIDMDGVIAKWKNVTFHEQLLEQGYFRNLEPMQEVIDNLKMLSESNEVEFYILSSYLVESKYALAEKKEWLAQYAPFIKEENWIFVKYGDKKNDYIENGVTSSDYLFDDLTKNLIEWERAGGSGVKNLNGINHTNKTWQGDFIHYQCDKYGYEACFGDCYWKEEGELSYE